MIKTDYYFRLIIPDGVEYVDGISNCFMMEENVSGARGRASYNAEGRYLGEEHEDFMRLNKTVYYSTLRGMGEGRHTIALVK